MNLQEVEKLATKVCLEQNGHIPQLMVCGKEYTSIIALADFPDTYEEKMKAMAQAAIQVVMKESDMIGEVKKVFFISEAWLSVMKKEDFNLKSFIMPSKDPERIEVLIVAELDVVENTQNASSFKIKRNDKKRIIDFQKMPMPTAETKSNLLDAFMKTYYFALVKKNEMRSQKIKKIIIN